MRIAAVVFRCLLGLLVFPASAQPLPGTPADFGFDSLAASLDLENPSVVFSYKSGRHLGSSVGFHVSDPGGRKIGTFVPYNSSSDPEAEVVTYRLARFLGVSAIYNPVTYYELGPTAAGRFRSMLTKRGEGDPDRRKNHAATLHQLKVHPGFLTGIFRLRFRGKRYAADALGTEGRLNTGTALAGFIRANGPMPGGKAMTIPGVRGARKEYPRPAEKESELARQLSTILLLDQLTGQWDRFWRNLEAVGDSTGRLRLLARDNGGATPYDWEVEWYANYERWVSRYDADVIERLIDLDAFLDGRQPKLGAFEKVDDWKHTIGFLRDESFSIFRRKLGQLIAKRLPALQHQPGARIFFADSGPMAGELLAQAPADGRSDELWRRAASFRPSAPLPTINSFEARARARPGGKSRAAVDDED